VNLSYREQDRVLKGAITIYPRTSLLSDQWNRIDLLPLAHFELPKKNKIRLLEKKIEKVTV